MFSCVGHHDKPAACSLEDTSAGTLTTRKRRMTAAADEDAEVRACVYMKLFIVQTTGWRDGAGMGLMVARQ